MLATTVWACSDMFAAATGTSARRCQQMSKVSCTTMRLLLLRCKRSKLYMSTYLWLTLPVQATASPNLAACAAPAWPHSSTP